MLVYARVKKLNGTNITGESQSVEVLIMNGGKWLVDAGPGVITTAGNGTFVFQVSGPGHYWFRINDGSAKEGCVMVDLSTGSDPTSPLVLHRIYPDCPTAPVRVRGRIKDMDGVNLTSMQNMEWDQDGNWSMTTGSGPTVADDGRYEVSLPSLDFNVNINGYPATPATYTVPTAPAAKAFRTDHPAT